MTRLLRIGLLALLLAIALPPGGPAFVEPLAAKAPVPKDRPSKRVVSLETALSASTMENLTTIKTPFGSNDARNLTRIRKAAGSMGLSSAFLVSGNDRSEVLRATANVLGSVWDARQVAPAYRADDVEYDKIGNVPRDIWVCAYLGTAGSSPPLFELTGVEVQGEIVRVHFKTVTGGISCDWNQYIVWANLGRLRPGTYRVDLVDVGEESHGVVSSRNVIVPDTKK